MNKWMNLAYNKEPGKIKWAHSNDKVSMMTFFKSKQLL